MLQNSTELDGLEFLKLAGEDDLLREQATNILDTYSHTWDILAEALQNSIDAIEKAASLDAQIIKSVRVVFDARSRSIEVSDTGSGMSLETLKKVLIPNFGTKRDAADSRGEKGLGLSFILLSCNRFRIETCDGQQAIYTEVDRANDWVKRKNPNRLTFQNTKIDSPKQFQQSKTYTRIWAELITMPDDNNEDLFGYNRSRVIYALRSKTAVGNTFPLFNNEQQPPVDIHIELKYIDGEGIEGPYENVPYRYAPPDEFLRPQDVGTWGNVSHDILQNKKIRVKAVKYNGVTKTDSGQSIKWYAFVSSRTTFDDISSESNIRYENRDDPSQDRNDLEPGIFVSTRTMPTAIQIPPPRSQQAAYWGSYFILLEYDNLKLDMGRKHIRGGANLMLRTVARSIFNETVNSLPQFISKTVQPFKLLDKENSLDELKAKSRTAEDLGLPQIPYLKVPTEEQDVISVFHELLGNGLLKGYRTYRSAINEQYDAFINYKPDQTVLGEIVKRSKIPSNGYDFFAEFKFEASRILPDYETIKNPRDIKLLICWQLDPKPFKDQNITVLEIEPGGSHFHGVSHELEFPVSFAFADNNILPVICLKSYIEMLKSAQ